MKVRRAATLLLALLVLLTGDSRAVTGAITREAAERVASGILSKSSGGASGKAVELLAGKIQVLVSQYGDDALRAVTRSGPAGVEAIRKAGAGAPYAIKMINTFGDDALVILARPEGMKIYRSYGDEAVQAMLRHAGVAEPLIGRFGGGAAEALAKISPRNGRRLAMLAEEQIGLTGEAAPILSVLARYGDPAMEFIWRNKSALAVSSVLITFLQDPGPFITGTKELAGVALHLPETVATQVGTEIARNTDGTVLVLVIGGVGMLYLVIRRNRGRSWRGDGRGGLE